MKKTVYTLAWDTNEGLGSQPFPTFREAAETLLSDIDEYAEKAADNDKQQWQESVRPELAKLIGEDGYIGFIEKIRTIDFEPLLDMDSFALDMHEIEYPDPMPEHVMIYLSKDGNEFAMSKNVKVLFAEEFSDTEEFDAALTEMNSHRNSSFRYFDKLTIVGVKNRIKALRAKIEEKQKSFKTSSLEN